MIMMGPSFVLAFQSSTRTTTMTVGQRVLRPPGGNARQYRYTTTTTTTTSTRQLLWSSSTSNQQEQEQQESETSSSETNGTTLDTPTTTTTTTDVVKKNNWNVFDLYSQYAQRLWKETNVQAREQIASDTLVLQIKHLQQTLKEDDVLHKGTVSKQRREDLITTLQDFLSTITTTTTTSNNNKDATDMTATQTETTKAKSSTSTNGTPIQQDSQLSSITSPSSSSTSTSMTTTTASTTKKPKKQRSIVFGAAMGAVVAAWVFSGNYIFTGLFTLMTVLGQLEYYRMVINTGVYPARRISIIGACSMFLTALFSPQLHEICLPIFGLWSMIWFLTMKRSATTIPEVATTFTGMFYLGYVPSFWVRINAASGNNFPIVDTTRLAPWLGPKLQSWTMYWLHRLPPKVAKAIHLPITTGSVFIFWTWLCIAFSDVGAYFVGKSFGKTKLGAVAPAAGVTSPNKTVEGVIGGCTVSAALGVLGAWVQKWPYFVWTGALHGTLLGLLGLIGDLTASMLKRDAGLKDFGDLIPEHGGILDRVDSFVWAAPYS